MGRPESWESLPSFKISPGKTFLGLDKSRSYCFTLPKDTYSAFIEYFELSADKLQEEVFFIIDSNPYCATLRLAIQDRSKTRKLEKKDLPFRELLQFSWKGQKLTIRALDECCEKSIDDLNKIGVNESQNLTFCHLRENYFIIFVEHKPRIEVLNRSIKPKKTNPSTNQYDDYFDFEDP
jgi:hypothetical protein